MYYSIKNNFLEVKVWNKLESFKLKSCGGVRWDDNKKLFICPLQVDFLKKFIEVFQPKDNIHTLLEECKDRDIKNASIMQHCINMKNDPTIATPIDDLGNFSYGMKREQKISLYASLAIPRFGLFLDMGLGKTKICIDNLSIRFIEGKVKKCLVVCPKENIKNTWLVELEKHCKVNIPITIIMGAKKKKIDTIETESRDCYVHIMSFDSVRLYSDILPDYDMVIFDESKMVAGKSKRGEEAFYVSSRAKYTILATGTPNTLRSAKDIFYQFCVLNFGQTFGLSYYSFRNEYFIDVGESYPKWILKSDSVKRINDKMASNAIFYKKEECLDLPERTINHELVRSTYIQNKMKELFLNKKSVLEKDIELEKLFFKYGVNYYEEIARINSAYPIANLIKAQEITSGFYKPYSNRERTVSFATLKLDRLLELLKRFPDEKIIVWCQFIEEISRIKEKLNKEDINYYELSGRKRELKEWKDDENVNIIIGMMSIGRGFTMNEASKVIYYSVDYDLDNYKQSVDRNYRIGQDKPVDVFIIQVEDSIDEYIIDSLNKTNKFSKRLTKSGFKKALNGKSNYF